MNHKSVEAVTVVGSDKALLQMAREHLNEWASCLDDPRIDIVYHSPLEWATTYSGPTFDMALVDLSSMDEEDTVAIVLDGTAFYQALKVISCRTGVSAMNLAAEARAVDSPTKGGRSKNIKVMQRALLLKSLNAIKEFSSIRRTDVSWWHSRSTTMPPGGLQTRARLITKFERDQIKRVGWSSFEGLGRCHHAGLHKNLSKSSTDCRKRPLKSQGRHHGCVGSILWISHAAW